MRREAIKEWAEWDDQQREIAMSKIPGWQRSIPFVAAACEEMDYDVVFPAMPVTNKAKDIKKAHREKAHKEPVFNVMVARPVTKQEMESTPKGREAIAKEWGGHRAKKTWDESTVREWDDVKTETKAKHTKAGKEVVKTHVASLMEVDVEKTSLDSYRFIPSSTSNAGGDIASDRSIQTGEFVFYWSRGQLASQRW
jgi:hypothetical protein